MQEILTPADQLQEAATAYRQGSYLEAAQAYEAAARGFMALHDPLAAAEAQNNASVAWIMANQPEAALAAVRGTAETFARAGDQRRQGIALGNLASAYEALHRPAEAMQAYQQAASLLEACGEAELRLSALQALSALQLKSGHQLEALASMHAGLEGLEKRSLKQRLLKRLLRFPYQLLDKLS